MAKATTKPPKPPPQPPPPQPPRRSGQPHDHLFGLVFGDKAHAAPYLQAVLPEHISQRLDFTQLQAVPTRILTEELGMTESDVLFTAPLDNGTLCYLQIEQQTSGYRLIVFRMLDYAKAIGQQHMRQHKGAGLPAVAQVVLYNGKEPWTYPLRIRDLITGADNAEDVTQLGLVPGFTITKLDPLNQVSAQELRGRGQTPAGLVALALMKLTPRSATLDVELRPWADDIRAVLDAGPDGEIFQAMVTYVNLVSATPKEQLRRLFADIDPRAEMTYMTTADMIRAEGITETLKATLQDMLRIRFVEVPADKVAAVQNGSLRELETWMRNFANATTIDEVFAARLNGHNGTNGSGPAK